MAMTLPKDIGLVMVKSYFEKEITAYLMFIISGPQKVFLFLKHIRNTNSSYRSQLLRFHFQIQCVDVSTAFEQQQIRIPQNNFRVGEY